MKIQVKPAETTVYKGVDKASLTWEHINVNVKSKGHLPCIAPDTDSFRQQILRDVSGHVEAGSLLAILGASGSGKTTLLNTLTYRTNKDTLAVTGNILVNGANVGNGIRNILAYVPQHDLFMGTLTVKEHLIFRAMLRMDRELNKKQRLQRVDDVLKELGLTECSNSRIGDPATGKGISGGQSRRLSFASEILTNPPLMFCDEPTSGLDTFMAGNVIQTLKAESNVGRTVLCTIHQPSSEIFALFDNILVMAEGRVAFMGSSHDALSFFSSVGYPCPKNFNPADFYVLTLAVRPGKEDDCRQKIETICDKFESSSYSSKIKKDSQMVSSEADHLEIKDSILKEDRFKASWLVQMSTLLSRTAKTTFRDTLMLSISIGETLGMALLHGLLFLRRDTDQIGVMDINGALFLMLLSFSVTSMYSVLNTFPVEVPIFVREYSIELYRIDVYYISKMLVELPSHLIMPVAFCAIAYWMIVWFVYYMVIGEVIRPDLSTVLMLVAGLYGTVEAFLIFTGVQMVVANVSVSFGYLISAGSPSAEVAIGIAAPAVICFMMFGGLFMNSDSFPVYFVWLEYISWFKYANELVTLNQWENIDTIDCDAPGDSAECLFSNGQDVINYFNYDKDNKTLDIILLGVMLVGFRVLGFIVLLIRAKLSRN